VAESLTIPKKRILDPKNPLLIARMFLDSLRTQDGEDTLRYYAGDSYIWEGQSYREAEETEVRKLLYRFYEESEECVRRGDVEEYVSCKPTKSRIDQLLDALRAESFLAASIPLPSWLDGRKVDPRECLICRNGIVHLPTFVNGNRHYMEPPTPLYFSTSALPFDFDPNATEPAAWLAFLRQIFDGDLECISTLQQWFGYCLTSDMRQQKIMIIFGPKRGGKGTISRILTALLGSRNVANPTLCSLTTNFGLWPLIGKPLAIIGDARLSGRTDHAIITERLLSISGEDSLTIDRKNREPITVKLPTRIMLLTNELPRLSDASGTMASRFIPLQVRQSFFGREDLQLECRLMAELPAIMQWSIEGWKELRDQRRFTMPASSTAAVADIDSLGSPVIQFVRDRCTVGPGHWVDRDTLFAAWLEWCTSEGREHPASKSVFGRDLAAAFPGIRTTQPRIGGDRFRRYEGISLGVQLEYQGEV
jgi:putative DNA primase/helicase